MASRDIKGFYKQQKQRQRQRKSAPATSTSTSTSKTKSRSGSGATVGATRSQTPALLAHGTPDLTTEDYSEEEERLSQFDMDMRYGPCIGMSRLERWKRASAMGLHPPADVAQILSNPNAPHLLESLWDGRI